VKRIVTLVSGISLAAGVGLYPSAAQYFSNLALRREINAYVAEVSSPSAAERNNELLIAAREYNQRLTEGTLRLTNEVEDSYYQSLLKVEDSAASLLMGYLEVPAISLRLPFYHGTTDEVLEFGAGHIYGTSLPIGGAGTHAALSAHNGMPGATLFTKLPRVTIGDYFSLYVADQTLWYQVIRIEEVSPEALDAIVPEGDADLVTLVTCVPIGVNNRRLLVTGERSGPPPQEALAGLGGYGAMMPWWAVYFIGTVGGTYLLGRFAFFRKDYAKALVEPDLVVEPDSVVEEASMVEAISLVEPVETASEVPPPCPNCSSAATEPQPRGRHLRISDTQKDGSNA